jgi:antitoxin (DNA-binding transcriptional repressor) of toxin-antitoxin stability system
MCQVNVFQAKTELSRLISALENGEEEEIVIARNGKPVARLLRWSAKASKKRVGVAKGIFSVPEDFGADDAAIAALFSGTLR